MLIDSLRVTVNSNTLGILAKGEAFLSFPTTHPLTYWVEGCRAWWAPGLLVSCASGVPRLFPAICGAGGGEPWCIALVKGLGLGPRNVNLDVPHGRFSYVWCGVDGPVGVVGALVVPSGPLDSRIRYGDFGRAEKMCMSCPTGSQSPGSLLPRHKAKTGGHLFGY